MHAVIFLGFMALLARKLQLIVIGYHEPFAFPGIAGGLFAAGKDVVELAVLAALAYAFWRRYVRKPVRLEANREAVLILSLITTIMVTDFLFDGFRFALFAGSDAGIAHERAYAFAGRRVGDALSVLSPAIAQGRLRPFVLDAGPGRIRVPGDPSAGRALPHRDCAAGPVLSPGPARQPGAVGRPRGDAAATTRTRPTFASACVPRGTSRGRKVSMCSPAPSAAGARTPARRFSPASRCRRNGCTTVSSTICWSNAEHHRAREPATTRCRRSSAA